MKWLRTRENAAFAKGLMFGKAVGAKDERERIIKLLEAKHTMTEDEYHIMSCFGCKAMALIKEEQK